MPSVLREAVTEMLRWTSAAAAVDKDVESAKRHASKAEEKADSAAMYLAEGKQRLTTLLECLQRLGYAVDPALAAASKRSGRRSKSAPDPLLAAAWRARAEHGLGELTMTLRAGGGADVVLDGIPLKLSAALAQVVKHLHSGPRDGWLYSALADTLGITIRNLQVRVSRLRESLGRQGSTPGFVLTEGRGPSARLRLAMRVPGDAVSTRAGDP